MAACGSLEHIFEKPLPDNPTLLESLSSWKQIKSMKKAIDDSSFTEIFGELHFKESPLHANPNPPSPFLQSSPSSSLSSNSSDVIGIDIPKNGTNPNRSSTSSGYYPSCQTRQYKHSDSFSSESLSLCTEGLGFESFDEVEDLLRNDIRNDDNGHRQEEGKKGLMRNTWENHHWNESKRSRMCRGEFPPPISCIGRSGKPWVFFKSYRENGRFILKEVRIPTQEFLHACREDGRLKLQFIQSDDEAFDEDDEEENSEVENEENNNDGNGKDGDADGNDYERENGEGKGEENEEEESGDVNVS